MRKKGIGVWLLIALFTALVTMGGCGGDEKKKETVAPPEEVKILEIGNSHTYDALEYLYDILKNMGVQKVAVGAMYIPACSLEMHYQNATNGLPAYEYKFISDDSWMWKTEANKDIETVVKSEEWDIITVQQRSAVAGNQNSFGKLDGLLECLDEWKDAETKIAYHMTWADAKTCRRAEFSAYQYDQAVMYQSIVDAVKAVVAPREDIAVIVPTGTAIQNARTSDLGDDLTRDGYHLDYGIGRYIAGLAYARAITGASIDGVTYAPKGVSEQMRSLAIEAANHAIEKPFEVTKSKLSAN